MTLLNAENAKRTRPHTDICIQIVR